MKFGDYIKNKLPEWPNWINALLLRLNCFGGLVYGISYRRFKKHLNEACPEKLLIDSVNYAIRHVPYYRNKYGNITIRSKEEFQKRIGFINKDEVMAHWNEFLVDDIDWKKVCLGTTGGTSGKPLKLVMPNNRYASELAFMHTMWEKSGWHYHTRGVIRNHNLNGREYTINPILREIIFDPHRMSGSYAQTIYNTLRRYNVRYVTAYPSNAYQFCLLCLKQGLDISFISAFLCGSEGVTEEKRLFFERHGIRVLTWYGHSEKLILGSNDTLSWDICIEPNYGFFELINNEGEAIETTGAEGEMTGTTFYNKVFPLIRYRTGDFAKIANLDGSVTLSSIQGRREKSLIFRIDGSTTSTTILNLHNDFYEHIDGIQYIQEKVGYLKVLLIKNDSFTKKDEDFITSHIANAMGGREYIDIEYVDRLIYQANGKFLPLISKISN